MMNDPNDLLEEFDQGLIRNFVPDEVAESLPDVGKVLFESLFPSEVYGGILAQLNPPGPFVAPLPNFAKDVWLTYRDSTVERRFVKWEAELTQWSFAFGPLLFFCCILLHLSLCSSVPIFSSIKQTSLDWPCGGGGGGGNNRDSTLTFLIATSLIWIPVFAALTPKIRKWKYKELVSAIHQLLFGILVLLYLRELVGESEMELNLILFCTIPILLESVLFRVRLRWQVPLSAVIASLVVTPWFTNIEDVGDSGSVLKTTPKIEVLANMIAMIILPLCLVALYESRSRRRFEKTF